MANKKGRAGVVLLCITVAITFFSHLSNDWIVILCVILSFLLLYAFGDYPTRGTDAFQQFVRWAFLLLICAGVSIAWGWYWWQRIAVSPGRAQFQGYSNETFNFSVRNDRTDDVYDIQIPFLIGHGKHWDGKLSAKVSSDGEQPQRVYDDYNYCYGEGSGNVHDIKPNEQEVLIVRIRHLPPSGIGNFSITYTGGEKFDTAPGTPTFVSEPSSYSSTQATVGVRGDYRICKFVIATDGLVGK